METVIMAAGVIFAVVMLFLLPKYAKFIHQQPKLHMEEMRRREEEEKKLKNEGNDPHQS